MIFPFKEETIDATYAFVEEWLVLQYNNNYTGRPMEYLPFAVSDGMLAAVDRNAFRTLTSAVSRCYRHFFPRRDFEPFVVNSDVINMRLLVHPFWADLNTMHAVSRGETKNNPAYIEISSLPPNERIPETFYQVFSQAINIGTINPDDDDDDVLDFDNPDEVDEINGTEEDEEEDMRRTEVERPTRRRVVRRRRPVGVRQDDTDPRDEETPAPPEEAAPSASEIIPEDIAHLSKEVRKEMLDFERDYLPNSGMVFGVNVITMKQHGERWMAAFDDSISAESKEILSKLASDIKKHVIVLRNHDAVCERLASGAPPNADKYVLIIRSNPSSRFTRIAYAASSRSPIRTQFIYGHAVSELYTLNASDVNAEILRVRHNTSISSEERQSRIDEIVKSRKNSPYSPYDRVYKDTYTNTTWAVQKGILVDTMLNIYHISKSVLELLAKELGRRLLKQLTYEQMIAEDASYSEGIISRNAGEFAKNAMESSTEMVRKIQNEYDSMQVRYKSLMDEILAMANQMKKYQTLLSSFDKKKFEEEAFDRCREDYESACSINKVQSIYIENSTIHVFTKNLYAKDPRVNTWHDIGTFHITLNFSSSNYDEQCLKIVNTKHMIHGMHSGMNAPHVFEDGHACHGNLVMQIANAYKEKSLYQCVLMLIIFLETANVDDPAGTHVNKWPQVGEEIAMGTPTSDGELSDKLGARADEKEPDEFDELCAEAIPVHI